MALTDDTIDDYINLDMTEVNIETAQDDKDLNSNIKMACADKLLFR